MKEPFMRIISVIVPAIIIFMIIQKDIPRPVAILNCTTCELSVYNEEEKLTRIRAHYSSKYKEYREIDIELETTKANICQELAKKDPQIKFDKGVFCLITVDDKGPSVLLMEDELIGKDSLIEIYQMRS